MCKKARVRERVQENTNTSMLFVMSTLQHFATLRNTLQTFPHIIFLALTLPLQRLIRFEIDSLLQKSPTKLTLFCDITSSAFASFLDSLAIFVLARSTLKWH